MGMERADAYFATDAGVDCVFDQAEPRGEAVVSWNENKRCACGNAVSVKKGFGAVCERCDRIEKSLHNQLMDSKTRSGVAGAVDCYAVRIPRKDSGAGFR